MMRAIATSYLALTVAGALGCSRPDAAPAAPPPPVPLAQAPDSFMTVEGIRLRYRESGAGEPIVLLHGFVDDMQVWFGLGDSLATEHRVIALDQRGHGESDAPAGASGYGREMGEDVIRLLDHLGLRRAHLAGHSMGAVIASYVAVRHPDRVATVSLLAPAFYADSAAAASIMMPFAEDLERGVGLRNLLRRFAPELTDSAANAFNAELMAAGDRDMMIGIMRSFGAFTVGQQGAATASVPALVAIGDADVLVTQARDLSGWWPHARLLEVPGADHMGILGSPETLAAMREQVRVASTNTPAR